MARVLVSYPRSYEGYVSGCRSNVLSECFRGHEEAVRVSDVSYARVMAHRALRRLLNAIMLGRRVTGFVCGNKRLGLVEECQNAREYLGELVEKYKRLVDRFRELSRLVGVKLTQEERIQGYNEITETALSEAQSAEAYFTELLATTIQTLYQARQNRIAHLRRIT